MLYGALGVIGLIIFTSAVVVLIRSVEAVIGALEGIAKEEKERQDDRRL
jgi:hypothetical protein